MGYWSVAVMTRCLALLLCLSPLVRVGAADTLTLMKECSGAGITLVVQTWAPEGPEHINGAPQPTFPDSVLEVFKNKTDANATKDALIRELAPTLAQQGFHIFRVSGTLWIAPQDAPPVFGLHLTVTQQATWTLEATLQVFASEGQCVMPPGNPRDPFSTGACVVDLKPGEYSLAQVLCLAAATHRDYLGWMVRCSQVGHTGEKQVYFEVRPFCPRFQLHKGMLIAVK